MIKLIAFYLIILNLAFFGALDRIQKAIEKKEYEKALELIAKGYEKEPANPGIDYYHGIILFDSTYAKYHLDSARILAENSLVKFENASPDIIEEINEDGITLEKLRNLHELVRDRSFKITLDSLSIASATSFQKRFPNSIYESDLKYKVDSMEFRIARLARTQEALLLYIKDHPASQFNVKADSILDDMRYSVLENTGDLQAFMSFHAKYPTTRHKNKVERFILKASTASHTEEDYINFIRLASNTYLKKKAADVLYYQSNKVNTDLHPLKDSLNLISPFHKTELYPVIQNGLFGFYDRDGEKNISHKYLSTLDLYKCGLTKDDWVFVKTNNTGQLLTKRGNVVVSSAGDYRSVSEDTGLLLQDGKWYLYHKSGFKILEDHIDEAAVIDDRWIKVKKDNKWGLVSFMGLYVAEIIYDDIFKLESFWVFEKNSRLAVYTDELILDEIEDRGISLEFKFDDIELVDENALIGFRDEKECLLDSTLKFLIPWGNYEIYPESSGWYLRSPDGFRLYNETEEDLIDKNFPYLESNEGWLALKTEKDWMLVPKHDGLSPTFSHDSVRLLSKHVAIIFDGENGRLQFSSGKEISIDDRQIRTFQNRSQYVSLIDGSNTTIYDKLGNEIISGKFNNTIFLNDSLIRVQVKGKQGLIHAKGDWILNPVFDTIDEKEGLVLTLIDGKIGCYDPQINELIKTEYEARIERIGKFYLAKKDGKFGIINHVKEVVIPFDYDEIKQWNDTSYLTRNSNEFLIINQQEEAVYEPIESVKTVISNDTHSICRFVKNGKYGLLSSQYGELLEPEFTDIFNIGSKDNPLIFADQHLDKAGFHVVSYVSEKGELILSKAYTKDEFDKILCDD